MKKLVGRPSNKRRMKSFYADMATIRRIKQVAHKYDCSESSVIRQAIKDYKEALEVMHESIREIHIP